MLWTFLNGKKELELFRSARSSFERCAAYRTWTIRSMIIFGAYSLVAMILLGNINTMFSLPSEFGEFFDISIQYILGTSSQTTKIAAEEDLSTLFLIIILPVFAGIAFGVTLSNFARVHIERRTGKAAFNNDVSLLFAQNMRERKYALLMSVNAGVSEELFFRLVLPLLLFRILDSAALALLLSTLLFGLLHSYQGLVGILVTTLLGAFFVAIFIATGSIGWAILIHIAIDINGLILIPFFHQKLTPSSG